MIDLESIFGEPSPPAPSLVARENQAALGGIDPTDHDALPEPLDFGPDGWPVDSVTPQDCPTCPGLLTWQDVAGRWRCETCDSDALARAMRLADAAARSRQRWPAESAPRTAPGRGPAALLGLELRPTKPARAKKRTTKPKGR